MQRDYFRDIEHIRMLMSAARRVDRRERDRFPTRLVQRHAVRARRVVSEHSGHRFGTVGLRVINELLAFRKDDRRQWEFGIGQ